MRRGCLQVMENAGKSFVQVVGFIHQQDIQVLDAVQRLGIYTQLASLMRAFNTRVSTAAYATPNLFNQVLSPQSTVLTTTTTYSFKKKGNK